MKKIVILTIILNMFASMNMLAQEKDYFGTKHEISIQTSEVLSIENYNYPYFYPEIYLSSSSYMPYPYPYYPMIQNRPLFGISYKLHFKNSALRLSTSGRYKTTNEDWKDDYSNTNFSNSESSTIVNSSYLGYEFHKNFTRTQFIYGLDVGFKYSKYNYSSYNENEYNDYEGNLIKSIYISETNTEENTYRITPFMGIRFFITPHFSISTESKLLFEYMDSKSNNYYKNEYGSEIYESNNNTKAIEKGIGLMPLGNLSLNIHF